jgi:hypothetical protein
MKPRIKNTDVITLQPNDGAAIWALGANIENIGSYTLYIRTTPRSVTISDRPPASYGRKAQDLSLAAMPERSKAIKR